MRQWWSRTRAARAGAVLAVGVTVGAGSGVVLGAAHLPGVGDEAARAAGRPAPAPTNAPLRVGGAAANDQVAAMSGQLALGGVRTLDGAVEAFTAYAGWLVGSPAAAADPDGAARAVGSPALDVADARALTQMGRAPGDGLSASRGAYRLLASSGPGSAPEEAMVQVDAPLRVGGRTRWCIVGGVVRWSPAGWRLESMRPTEVDQPPLARADVRAMTSAERARTLPGLGWQLFASGASR